MQKTIDYRHGKITFLENDVYIGRALTEYGEREEEEVQFILSLINPGEIAFDVGANIGAITIPLARKAGQVFAFEPQPRMFQLLQENIELNGLRNVLAFDYALGDKRGRAGIGADRDYNEVNNFGGIPLTAGDDVDVRTIDEEFSDLWAHLIKIDVEGMEDDVLRGAVKMLERCRPLLYVENDYAQNGPELFRLIDSLGYEMYWHTPLLFNPDNFKRNKENVFPGIAAANMVCVPIGRQCKQVEHLRRASSPYDRFDSAIGVPAPKRRSNGWAGVARFGGIGDNLMAASVCGALKRKGYKVEMITGEKAAWTVFENNPNIDKLSVKSTDEMFQVGSLEWQKWFKGRAEEYDVFAQLSHTCEGLLAFFPSSSQFHWPANVRRSLANKNYLEMVHDIAGCAYDFGPLFYPSELELQQALEIKRDKIRSERCIAFCLSGSRNDKSHPRTPGIIARLIKELNLPVILLGDPQRNFEDAKAIEAFVKQTNGSTAGLHVAISCAPDPNTTYAWPIRRTLSLVNVCDLVIGPDTGVMWSVAFERVPKILLLGHASPENITKHWVNCTTLHAGGKVSCWPCHQLHDAQPGQYPPWCTPNEDNSGAACISDISVETIIQKAKEALNVVR